VDCDFSMIICAKTMFTIKQIIKGGALHEQNMMPFMSQLCFNYLRNLSVVCSNTLEVFVTALCLYELGK
jgi:hypothetical protein